MTSHTSLIVPVILSGGSGTRLWPMSTPERPKQFLALTGNETMFQLTAARTADPARFSPPIIVANARHAALIAEQLSAIGLQPKAVILEPMARNSAPAIALAALAAPESVLLVMPSDHAIADADAFGAAVARGLPFAEAGWLVTFGITPDTPETGFGYIRSADALAEGVVAVDRFIEKPEYARAEAMIAEGGHCWNGGIFLMRGQAYLDALGSHAPAVLAACKTAMSAARYDGATIHPDEAAFLTSPATSIDYAVMEKADRVAMVPIDMGWSDVGSWDAIHALAETDAAGNAVRGDVQLADSSGCLIETDGIRISGVGLQDLIVIASGNDVLILPRGQSQEAKRFAK
jgi:mannose-1-phosphate guanylyltransferase